MAHVAGVDEELRSIDVEHPAALFAGFVIGGTDLDEFARQAPRLNTDDLPILEFSTPRSLYANTTPAVEADLERRRSQAFPPLTGFDPARDLDADATFALGRAYAAFGVPQRGITWMERAVAIDPGSIAAWTGLGEICLQAGNASRALACADSALRRAPQDARALELEAAARARRP
jgi:tetratricopeptide (TPR) repeat protein